MPTLKKIFLIFILIFFLNTACQVPLFGKNTNENEQVITVITTDTPIPQTREAEEAATAQALAEKNQLATNIAQQPTIHAESTRQAEETLQVVRQTREAGINATEQAVVLQATQTAGPIFSFIEELKDEGILDSTDGIFYILDDYEASWAQLNWYQWEPTDYAPTNFVLTATIAYESASTTANWADSGCGFVFRDTGELNHYRALAALDGYVYLSGLKNGNWLSLGRGYYGRADLPTGSFELAIVANNDWFTIYLDGEQMIQRQESNHTEGYIGYTLASGTNKDFGTYCKLSDINLWILP